MSTKSGKNKIPVKILDMPEQGKKELTTFTHYVLASVDLQGNEKPNTEFTISKQGFEQTYKNRTAKPDGTADKSLFIVKKKK